MDNFRFAYLLIWPLLAAGSSVTSAQPGPASDNIPSVERGKSQTFLMKDKNGKWVPYGDLSYEEYERVYRIYENRNAPDKPPLYSYQSISVTGVANRAEAKLNLSLKIRTRVDGWARVPLRLGNVLLSEPAKGRNPSQRFLVFDEASDGYVYWIHGAADQEHALNLTAIAPTRYSGGRVHFEMDTPRIGGDSQLKLTVRSRDADQEVDENVSSVMRIGNQMEITASDLRPGFKISWKDSGAPPTKVTPRLRVQGEITARFLTQTDFQCQANLTVTSSRAPFSSLVVELPPDFQLDTDAEEPPGYKLTPVNRPPANKKNPTNKKNNVGKGQLVEVQFEQGALEQTIQLRAKPSAGVPQSNKRWEIGGFSVSGAQFQSGFVNLAVDPELTVDWIEGGQINRVETIATNLRDDGVVARFHYSGPFSLNVEPIRRRKRFGVEPEYVFLVNEDQIQLVAKLLCKQRGARTQNVNIDLTGWEIDEIVSEGLVDTKTTVPERVSPLKIQLNPAAVTSSGQFELTIHAHRAVNDAIDAKNNLSIPVPSPDVNILSPASVVISPAANVVLSHDMESTLGLTETTSPPSLTLPSGRQPPFVFRKDSESAPAVFVGRMDVMEQSINAKMSLGLEVVQRRVVVQQRLAYRIEYESATSLLIDVPRMLLGSRDFKVLIDNAEAIWDEKTTADPAEQQATVRVELPDGRIGSVELAVVSSVALPQFPGDEPVKFSVPFVRPDVLDGDFGIDQLEVELSESVQLEPNEQDWQLETETDADGFRSNIYRQVDEAKVASLDFTAVVADPVRQSSNVVEQAWVRSWFSSKARQDRAVFRISTTQSRMRIRLPIGGQLDELLVDGQPITVAQSEGTNGYIMLLPVAPELNRQRRRHVIEAWYSFADQSSQPSNHSIELPELIGAGWVKRFYWQVILPPDEYLLTEPADLTSEQRWRWNGFYSSRVSNITQKELESATSATSDNPLPSAVNQYVFSSFGKVDRIEFASVNRLHLILVVSVVAFLAGVALVYYSSLRRPISLLAFGLVLVAAGVAYPSPALQVAQIAAVASVFVFAVRLLKWFVERPRGNQPIVRGTSRSAYDVDSTETMAAPAGIGSHTSTASARLAIRLNDPSTHIPEAQPNP